jgi:molybdopterin molybdotransferase
VRLPLTEALGLGLAEDVRAANAVPGFARSTVDGYAVAARDTFGASESLPAYLTVGGEVPVGRAPGAPLLPGQAAQVATGSMLPGGADAVVMVEFTEMMPAGEVAVTRPAGPGENVIGADEDVSAGALVLPAGHRLRPQDLGVLAAVGLEEVSVHRRPRVAVVSTGDEVVPAAALPGPGQVRDVNAPALSGLVQSWGAKAVGCGILADRREELERGLRMAMGEADMVLVSGGSSVGSRDLVAASIAALGKPGVLVHGVAVRPGKPTILALADGKPVLGLPGHPASALVVLWLFGRLAVSRLMGLRGELGSEPPVRARLTRNLASAAGREEYVRATLTRDESSGCWLAEPVFGKSGLISTLVRGDGLLRIPAPRGGLAAGEEVEVFVFTGMTGVSKA